jgi:hypothetical protein
MFFKAAIDGSLTAILKAQTDGVKKIVTDTVVEATTKLKEDLRAQVRAAGLGDRLAKSFQQQRYPKTGTSLEAAGVVFSKANKIHRAFIDGVTIKGKQGLFLAIPTSACPKQIAGKRASPALFERYIGKLRFVYRANAPSLLVAENQRANTGKRGGYRRATEKQLASGRGLATVVMFILVRQVRLRKLISLDVAERSATDFLARTLQSRLENIPESPSR